MNEDKIKEAIHLLRANNYIVKKFTKPMEADANECARMEEEGQQMECCGCSCSICLIQ